MYMYFIDKNVWYENTVVLSMTMRKQLDIFCLDVSYFFLLTLV